MPGRIPAVVVRDPAVQDTVVRAILAEADDLQVSEFVEGYDAAWGALEDRTAEVVVVVCEPDSGDALWFVREAGRRAPERPVVILSGPSANGFVRHAFEAGAEDLVMAASGLAADPRIVAAQLGFAVEKAVARRSGGGPAAATSLGSLICVLGPKGGIGKTLTSANLAVGLALAGKRVVVVDLDLQFGDVGLSLGLEPKRTIYDLVKSGGSLDAEKLEAYLTAHESGVKVLVAPVRPDQASAISTDFLKELYALLRTTADFVIVDTPPGFSGEVIASIDASTDVCLVGMLDSLSLKNTKLGLETLELMGYDRGRIRVVLNRADSNVGITREDVTAIVGREPDVLVPSHRDVARSVNEGNPVVRSRPRSDAARAFCGLAELYSPSGPRGRGDGGKRRLRRKG